MTPTLLLAAAKAPTHPALRWTPLLDGTSRAQHRRNTDGTGTACGIVAHLTLAEPDDERCTAGCFA